MPRRIKYEYLVYPPNYEPLTSDKYKKVKTKLKAMLIAIAMGSGATIFKNCYRYWGNSKKYAQYYTVCEWYIK